jgi:hypothetical protein
MSSGRAARTSKAGGGTRHLQTGDGWDVWDLEATSGAAGLVGTCERATVGMSPDLEVTTSGEAVLVGTSERASVAVIRDSEVTTRGAGCDGRLRDGRPSQ